MTSQYKNIVCTIIVNVFFLSLANAQSDKTAIPHRSQAIYFNLGGSSPLVAIQYDRRLFKKKNGVGLGLGFGYYGGFNSATISIPVAVNYLIGNKNHFLELAGGVTWMSDRRDFFDDGKKGGGLIEFANAGYRFQHKKGLLFRTGISPIIARNLNWSAYLGLGFAF